jgi:fido (protein-threonine AMPylation protein)
MGVPTFNRFHDEPGSPFYQAVDMSPEETWAEIVRGVENALVEICERRAAGRISLEPTLIARWHEEIFESTFPQDAGRFRGKLPNGEWEHVSFGIHVGTAKTRRVADAKGSHPTRIHENIDRACQQYGVVLGDLLVGRTVMPLKDATFACARFYAKLCSIHPFIDGNLRTAFVALQAGLLNFDLPAIEFPIYEDHATCLDIALRIDQRQSYEPLAELIEHVLKSAN